mmetsp:Transcript_31208/g.68161  ORF Transcript_31208/g.68161 Transcript_31208/m.68161 type:complete len:257 (-) Transcript_31208:402-1172(-)|eukprot:CAMPEP_0118932384 /NCGR_PEP_ID=MMETSP1169-20130426/10054_1 /TAXON_ID=36882 /ORGANISM="Pyramimonas obovata, Strain CCMP722" /LENGTH=256 /DNA_ID=CAMNT_0006875035 /DNA_START=403 /DNA_END=1173 /DNA_ORIENTATION=+
MAGVGVLPGQPTALDLYHNGPAGAEVQGAAAGGVMQGIPPTSVYPPTEYEAPPSTDGMPAGVPTSDAAATSYMQQGQRTAYAYDPYYSGAVYGQSGLVASHLVGAALQQSRMALPAELVAEEPVYVNAKQYHGILRRRQQRAKQEAENKLVKSRKPYLHESRHAHALRRMRGPGGRFLTKAEKEAYIAQQEEKERQEAQLANGEKTSNGDIGTSAGTAGAESSTKQTALAIDAPADTAPATESEEGPDAKRLKTDS